MILTASDQRRRIRLQDYDYAQAGAYFVTTCARNRECLFGGITDGEMRQNGVGRMVEGVWNELAGRYPGVGTDVFALMPNHIHGIIWLSSSDANSKTPGCVSSSGIVGATPRGCPRVGRPTQQASGNSTTRGQAQGPAPTTLSLPDVVHRFKSLTTARYRQGVARSGWSPFQHRLGQRNYFEHVIRNEPALYRNPAQWDLDPENPLSTAPVSMGKGTESPSGISDPLTRNDYGKAF